MNTYEQAQALAADLLNAEGLLPWQIGKVINALLAEAQREHPGNVVLAAVGPLEQSSTGKIANVEASEVRAIVGQIVVATKPGRTDVA
jgi:hypothetical protein